MEGSIILREAKLKDCYDITEVNNEGFPFLDEESPEYFEWLIREGIGKIIVCEINGEIVGFVHYDIIRGKAIIHRIGVSEEFRRKGIGSSLLAKVEDLVKNKVNEIVAYIASRNRYSQKWFKRRGYVKVNNPSLYTGWLAVGDTTSIKRLKEIDESRILKRLDKIMYWWTPNLEDFLSKLKTAPGIVCLDESESVLIHFIVRPWYITAEYIAYSSELTNEELEELIFEISNTVAIEFNIPYCEAPIKPETVRNTWRYVWLEYPFIKKLR